jgi:hypothetical protein
MAMYGRGFTPIGFNSGTCQWDFTPNVSSTTRLLICLTKFYGTASTHHMGLGRPATTGTRTSGYYGTCFDENDPSVGSGYHIGIQWNPVNTAPTSYFKLHKATSAYYVLANWQFPRGLLVPYGERVCMWNIASCSTSYMSVSLAWDQ